MPLILSFLYFLTSITILAKKYSFGDKNAMTIGVTNAVTFVKIFLRECRMNFGEESEILEFKESTSELHQAIESIGAILNKHGYGKVLFGVFNNGELKGQVISDSTIRNLSDSILRDIEPRIIPTVERIVYENKEIIEVSFYGNHRPYSAFGRFLIRVGTQNRHMTRNELIKLIKEEDYSNSWEKEKSSITIEDIDDDALKEYYGEAVNCGRVALYKYDKKQLLTILDLFHNGVMNNAANILFGKKANISLKLACFATDSKITFTDLKVIKGNIYNLIREGLTYILNHINWDIEIGLVRKETPEIPLRAIREILINAFAHAIYNPTPEIEINIHPNKLTIFNPGSFPDGLTPNDFIEKDLSSIKRNPIILDVLYRCKDVEKSGTGFKRMNDSCSEMNISWSSENTAYGFYFTFNRKTNVTAFVTPNITAFSSLNKIEQEVFDLIENNPKITRKEIAIKINKTIRTVQRITDKLVDKKMLIRVGSNQYGYWEVIKKIRS